MQERILAICDPTDKTWVEKLRESSAVSLIIDTVGEKQVEKVCTYEYDVILLDAGAVENAPKFVRHLRLNWPRANIIVVTSSPDWNLARQCYMAGASDYVSKFFAGEAVRSAVF